MIILHKKMAMKSLALTLFKQLVDLSNKGLRLIIQKTIKVK